VACWLRMWFNAIYSDMLQLILIFSFSYYYVTLLQITPPLPEPPFPLPDLLLPSSSLTQPDWTKLNLTGPNNPTPWPDDPTGLDPTWPDSTWPDPTQPDRTWPGPAWPNEHGTVNLLKDKKSEWETVVQNNPFPYPCWICPCHTRCHHPCQAWYQVNLSSARKQKRVCEKKSASPFLSLSTLLPCQSTIVWICRVQKKREWARKSLCSEGQQATGRESDMGEKSLLTSVISTCVFLCFLLISCFALVDEARAKKS
jgi:hypothetical protein